MYISDLYDDDLEISIKVWKLGGDLKVGLGIFSPNNANTESHPCLHGDSSGRALGWVDFDLDVPPPCPGAQPFLPNSHQPMQNWADSGTLKVQPNPGARPDESPCNATVTVTQVVIVGNGAVGKSSMIQRYCRGIFTHNYKKTIGVDFLEKHLR